MKQLFNFKRLIKKYSVPCELLAESASGSYVGGEWVPGVAAESKMINGAVVMLKILQVRWRTWLRP